MLKKIKFIQGSHKVTKKSFYIQSYFFDEIAAGEQDTLNNNKYFTQKQFHKINKRDNKIRNY